MEKLCPEEELLAGYLEGDLSEKEKVKVESHLSDCEVCLHAVVISDDMVKRTDMSQLQNVPNQVTTAAIERIRERARPSTVPLKDIFKQSTKGLFTTVSDMVASLGGMQPNFATVRGSRTAATNNKALIAKSFKDIHAQIEIEKTAQGKAHIKVSFPKQGDQGKGVRVTLKKNGREISSFLVDNTGLVLFEDIPLDRYSLVFSKSGELLGTYFFQMKE
jgi:hypothetical protein